MRCLFLPEDERMLSTSAFDRGAVAVAMVLG